MVHPLALPPTFSPDMLDATAELASILARLQPPQAVAAAAAAAANANANDASDVPDVPDAEAAVASVVPLGGPQAGAPIALRDLPTATDAIKHKLKQARAQIQTLPDMQRTTGAQDIEIAQLETRIAAQKAVLVKLQAEGARFSGRP